MHKKLKGLLFCLSMLPITGKAQTVTGSGNSGKIPVFTGSSVLGNSNITQSGANTGIGTTSPSAPLTVVGDSYTVQENIATFQNGTNNAYTAMTGVGSTSAVPTWTNGSQVLEFVPYSTGNGTISAYTGSLIFQTSNRSNRMAITSGGYVGIGTMTPGASLEVDGNVKLTAGSGAAITFADGTTQSTAFTGVICGGDYAESVDVIGGRTSYEAGDLLVIDPKNPGRFLKSAEPYSTLVAGIYSTKPGTVGRRETTYAKTDTTPVPMAMMGIVPTKVTAENGPIQTGDLMVTSSTVGYAMRGTDRSRLTGAVVGKALGSLDSGTGVIEVLVTLQ